MRGISLEYIGRRLLMWLITIWAGATTIFAIPRLSPGDPIAAMIGRMSALGVTLPNAQELIDAWHKRLGLDDPWYIQYFKFLGNCITLDFGYSFTTFPTTVWELIGPALPWTIVLLSTTLIVTFVVGNIVGALMGWRKTPSGLRSLLPLSLIFSSIPPFIFGLLLLYVFAVNLHWLPQSGGYDGILTPGLNLPFLIDAGKHSILPAMAIMLTSMGGWALGMRGMMITTDGEDYMLLAQAKGLRTPYVFLRYALRNAVLPQLTGLALAIGLLIGGSTLVETFFAYPGIGKLLNYAILTSDSPLIQGVVFILILTTATAVLIIDVLYPLIDPRISFSKK